MWEEMGRAVMKALWLCFNPLSEHDAIAATVKQFLGFTTTPHKDDGQKDEVLKGDGKGQDGVQKKGQDGVQKKGQDGLKKKGQDGGTTRSRHKKTE